MMWIPSIGEEIVCHGEVFIVTKRAKTPTGEIYIYSDEVTRYPLEDCAPFSPDRPLSEDEILTMEMLIATMIKYNDPTDLELLSTLTQEQKKQVWDALTPEQQEGMKRLKAIAQGQGVAA